MAETIADKQAFRKIEIEVTRLDKLSILPCVAAKLLNKLNHPHLMASDLIDIIEADPALLAKTLSILPQNDIKIADKDFSLVHALDKIGPAKIRDILLNVKAYSA